MPPMCVITSYSIHYTKLYDVLDEGLAQPILIGRPAVIERRIAQAGLDLVVGRDFEVVNTEDDPRYLV